MKISISHLESFFIVLSFISTFPIPNSKLQWSEGNLRFFCVMLPVAGIIFGLSWPLMFFLISKLKFISETFKGFIMMFLTLSLSGGIHADGLMDTCDAFFSRKDRDSRLKILSDTHIGAFAVMGCVIIFMLKSFLFAEIFLHGDIKSLFLTPVYSRFGMGLLLNNMKFAKSDGLAKTLGASRSSHDNIFFAIFLALLISFSLNSKIILTMFIIILVFWKNFCMKIFGGITGDLLGAFVEVSEVFMLIGAVIESCI